MIPALCKVSQAFWNIVLVLLRALEWAATGFLLVRLGTEKQRGPGTCLKVQHKAGQSWGPELRARREAGWKGGQSQCQHIQLPSQLLVNILRINEHLSNQQGKMS